ncbi:MAG: DUF4340 domain-containing protein [Syntrophobacteraceae bacterium]
MKWRSTSVYFLVLLLVGAVYLVLDSKQKEAERLEKQSKLVFAFDAGPVNEIEIRSGEAGEIHLVREKNWRITRPVAADVDTTAFAGFFSALRDTERERKIEKPADNLAAFGLDKPSLVIRFLSGTEWLELQVGGKNPSETSRYAKTGENADVFMISSATYEALNPSLKNLRRKELFGWQTDQVRAVDVKWRSGDGFSLEEQEGTKQWKSTAQPGLEIKARKVQNLLDELHWLRAMDFAEKDAMPSSAQVEIRLHLKDGQTSVLNIADADQAKKQAIASSSEIEGPVLVASQILESIPRSVVSLADRSVIAAEAADIKEIAWKTENGSANLVRIDENSWGTKEGAAAPKPVEKPSTVRSFLAYMENIEYIETVEPGSNPPEGAPNSVQFVDALGKKSSLTWGALASENADPVTIWMQKEAAAREVKIKHEDVKRLDELLAKMSASAKGKQAASSE